MWIILALLSALFAGITAILAKCGMKDVDSTLATALRTIVVFIFSWILASISTPLSAIGTLSGRTWLFLVLSGLATGASWLCYFKALQKGDVNKVVPIDKSSTVLSMILAFLILGEPFSLISGISIILIGGGTLMMIEKKETGGNVEGRSYLLYAFLSALFAALTSILAKIGIEGIDSNLGTAIRTSVVLVMSWLMVGFTGKGKEIRRIGRRELLFIALSGLATGASWLCYFKALQMGRASVVVPIDKLSILISIAFSRIVFKERLSRPGAAGLLLIVIGTMLLLLPS